jgi:hypothetical protein
MRLKACRQYHPKTRLAAHHLSYASAARSSGNTSFIDRTPVSALKRSVSCESIELPDGQPAIASRRRELDS